MSNKKTGARTPRTAAYDVAIIGGGIIGASIAYELSQYQLRVVLLEKNPYFGDETSAGNSGVIHCGYDAAFPVEARLNVRGNYLWQTRWLKRLQVPHLAIPSLVTAFSAEEMKHVHMLYARGLKNGVPAAHLRVLDKTATLSLEPHLNPRVVGALYCDNSVAIDPVITTRALIGAARQNGVTARHEAEVTSITPAKGQYELTINHHEKIQATRVINVAGHYADAIARLAHEGDFQLNTRRGEYRVLARSERPKVHNVVFKVPTIHGKGVIVAPMLDGRVLVGPTATEGVAKADTRLVTREQYEKIGRIGLDLIPELDLERTEKTFAGSRPLYEATNDFLIDYGNSNHFIHVAGTQSPGLASAPAIAEEVRKLITKSGLKLAKNPRAKLKFQAVW